MSALATEVLPAPGGPEMTMTCVATSCWTRALRGAHVERDVEGGRRVRERAGRDQIDAGGPLPRLILEIAYLRFDQNGLIDGI